MEDEIIDINQEFIYLFNRLLFYSERHPELNMNVFARETDYFNIFVYDKNNFDAHIHIFKKSTNREIVSKVGEQSWQLSCGYIENDIKKYARKTSKGHYKNFSLKGNNTIGKWLDDGKIKRVDYLFNQWRTLLDHCLNEIKKTRKKEDKENSTQRSNSNSRRNPFGTLQVLE